MASEISIYAELLQNLRQISVAASLPTPANDQTTVTVAPESITIRHDGRIAQLRLPALVAAAACGALARPSQPSADSMSWRLPLAPQQQLKPVDQTAAVPWPATDLRPGGEVRCRGCDAVVVGEGRVAEWKDLPSENWAEMMEFWHCHKPGDEEHGHSHSHGGNHSHAPDGGAAGEVNGGAGAGKADETSLASRGYGASSIISAKEGVGFVDLTSLLFVEGDCEGVLYSLASGPGSTSRAGLMDEDVDGARKTIHISCAGCEARLGYFNDRTSAVTLFKWQVSCTTNRASVSPSSSQPPRPTIPECLSATLLATAARSGCSKVLVIPILEDNRSSNAGSPARSARVLHLWTLNSIIHYASTALPGEEAPVPAMKILYRTIERADADRMLENVVTDVQEVCLPAGAIATVAQTLESANSLLPTKEKGFGEWRIGLLRRWEVR